MVEHVTCFFGHVSIIAGNVVKTLKKTFKISAWKRNKSNRTFGCRPYLVSYKM